MQPESAAVLTITKKRFRNLTRLRGIVAHCASRDWSAGKAFAWLVTRMPQLRVRDTWPSIWGIKTAKQNAPTMF